MPNEMIALSRSELARIAPDYESMRTAIARCETVDEIARVADLAVAAQAYFRQSMDVENEMGSSRIRLRAERRLGEILRDMRENGERARSGEQDRIPSRGATLSDLGIPRDRASRAMQLADVPEAEFEAALAQPQIAQPRRILRETRPTEIREPSLVPIQQTLDLWGRVRDLGELLENGRLPPLEHWRMNLQPFQLDHLRRYLPRIVAYLSAICQEVER